MSTKKRFISYSLRDGKVTRESLIFLKRQQPLSVDCFVDILDNDSPEDKRQDRVIAELLSADDMLVVNSPSYQLSPWTNKELNYAKIWGKPVSNVDFTEIKKTNVITPMHKVFISFHHENDQWAKDRLIELNEKFKIFIDGSVEMGEIPDNWGSQEIREYIRDEHLKDTSVTILLCGTETKNRKHIDWELFSSMYNGKKNKRSGVLVINLPSVNCEYRTLCSQEEKDAILPDEKNWISINDRAEFERRYPYMPARIIDNLLKKDVKISVVNWSDLTVEKLELLIDKAYISRTTNDYDMSREMRMRNS